MELVTYDVDVPFDSDVVNAVSRPLFSIITAIWRALVAVLRKVYNEFLPFGPRWSVTEVLLLALVMRDMPRRTKYFVRWPMRVVINGMFVFMGKRMPFMFECTTGDWSKLYELLCQTRM